MRWTASRWNPRASASSARAAPRRGLVAYAARDPRGALHGALLLDVNLPHASAAAPASACAVPQFARLLQRLALRLAGDSRAQPGVQWPRSMAIR